jgi:DNA-binding MarR family transcriptional regulator
VAEEPRPSILWELFVAYQRTGQLISAALADTETPADDYAIYSRLATHGPKTPTELARDLGIPRSTLMLRFRRLGERGHATQVPNPLDGRSSLLTLTPDGRRVQQASLPRFRAVFADVARALEKPPEEVAEAIADLARAAEAVLQARRDEQILDVRRRAAADVES